MEIENSEDVWDFYHEVEDQEEFMFDEEVPQILTPSWYPLVVESDTEGEESIVDQIVLKVLFNQPVMIQRWLDISQPWEVTVDMEDKADRLKHSQDGLVDLESLNVIRRFWSGQTGHRVSTVNLRGVRTVDDNIFLQDIVVGSRNFVFTPRNLLDIEPSISYNLLPMLSFGVTLKQYLNKGGLLQGNVARTLKERTYLGQRTIVRWK